MAAVRSIVRCSGPAPAPPGAGPASARAASWVCHRTASAKTNSWPGVARKRPTGALSGSLASLLGPPVTRRGGRGAGTDGGRGGGGATVSDARRGGWRGCPATQAPTRASTTTARTSQRWHDLLIRHLLSQPPLDGAARVVGYRPVWQPP